MAKAKQKNEDLEPPKSPTPSLAELLGRSIDARLYDVRTAVPAEVLKYDLKKQCVDVQPLIKKVYDDGEALETAKVFNVPVAFPRAGEAYLALPIKKGDKVLLIVADRSLDKWKSTGGNVDPEDKRKHDLSDAVAIPGCYPFKEAAQINNANDLILRNKNSEIRMKSNGKLWISNSQHELLALLQTMTKTLQSMAQKVVAEVPGVAVEAAQLGQFAAKLKGFVA